MYLPPCKSFLEKKFKGFGKNKAALLWVLNNTYFDQNYYHDFNKDLQQEFEKDDRDGLFKHYLDNGWQEGRFPFQVTVDDYFYLETYPDVRNFYGSCQDLFVKHGYKEGRLPYLFNLDLEDYNRNLKIIEPSHKIIEGKKEMYDHFVKIGYHMLLK